MKYGMYYNRDTVGDILMIVFKPNEKPFFSKKSGEIVGIFDKNMQLIGYNIFNISKTIKIHAKGLIPVINKEVVDVINYMLENEGFEKIDYLNESGFKVATIDEIEEHPESEHLHICSVNIGEKENLQIVCGSFNAKKGIKVVCATPYTFMPNGQQIIPGELLGVQSNGMLCSGRELNLDGYENIRGLLILDDTYNIGDDFFNK